MKGVSHDAVRSNELTLKNFFSERFLTSIRSSASVEIIELSGNKKKLSRETTCTDTSKG
jgi:hypothetical protein